MEVARATGTRVTIHNTRIETLPPFEADAITARACASLTQLLDWAEPFVGQNTRAFFLKGKKVNEELTDARVKWNMQVELSPSLSDADGVIVQIGDLRRV